MTHLNCSNIVPRFGRSQYEQLYIRRFFVVVKLYPVYLVCVAIRRSYVHTVT